MILIEDKGQQDKKHTLKNQYFENKGISVKRLPLPVGDYIIANESVLDVIERKFKRRIEVKKMDFMGTYNICVDTKKDMQEIVGNICGKQHARFKDECVLAQNNGIKLFVLVENEDGITCINDVFSWINPRRMILVRDMTKIIGFRKNGTPIYGKKQKYPNATKGEQLAKSMLTMQSKYGVEFLFCRPEESGHKILELLGVEKGENE